MKFAPVMPASWMPVMDLGDYHLVNSHTVDLESPGLIDWLRGLCVGDEHWVVLDNGAYELGEAETDRYFEVASILSPDVMVCPDNPQEAERSYYLFSKYMRKCMELKWKQGGEVMIVPQGLSPKEWLDSLNRLMDESLEEFNYAPHVGVPKYLEMWGRVNLLPYLLERLPGEHIHILGTYASFDELVTIARAFPEVRGADSTWPVAYAIRDGCGLMPTPGGFKYAIQDWNANYGDRGELIRANIATCRCRLRELSI